MVMTAYQSHQSPKSKNPGYAVLASSITFGGLDIWMRIG
jgi:hypothetical protein